MIILSIDIGIKNLAYTIIEHCNETLHINKWEIINLCNIIPKCSMCNKNAKFSKNKYFYCNQHSKHSDYKIPNKNTKNISKQTIKSLKEIADECEIEYNKSSKKEEILKLIEEHLNNNCLNCVETINANNINLIDLGINLKLEFNKVFSNIDLDTIDMILIENQISPIANRMKTIQGMVAQYFIDKGNYNIEFISAVNKLKLFINNKKTSYGERKKLSIKYTQDFLEKKNDEEILNYFSKHNKKDDLADCLLQGLYYLVTYNNLIL